MSTKACLDDAEVATRRAFLVRVTVGGAALAWARCIPATTASFREPGIAARSALPQVVSFHMDQPYVDVSGVAVPYRPPAGSRSGQPLAQLGEELFRNSFFYV